MIEVGFIENDKKVSFTKSNNINVIFMKDKL